MEKSYRHRTGDSSRYKENRLILQLHLCQCHQNKQSLLHVEEVEAGQSSQKEPSSVDFRCEQDHLGVCSDLLDSA